MEACCTSIFLAVELPSPIITNGCQKIYKSNKNWKYQHLQSYEQP